MREHVGIIFGETDSFRFKVALLSPKSASRRDYVKVWDEALGWVLCQITKITRSNERFSEENVFEGEETTGSGEKLIAHVEVIGARDEHGTLRSPRVPFTPGDKVFKADTPLIRQVLGMIDTGLYIGMLDGYTIPVYLEPNHLVQKHCSILAKTGSGKSYTAGVIIEELMEQDVPLLIMDPHGEYVSLKQPAKNRDIEKFGLSTKGYASNVVVYSPPLGASSEADKVLHINGTI